MGPTFTQASAKMNNVDAEVALLQEEIRRLGTESADGAVITVTFGTLFHDDRCAQVFEALVGTLRAAKKRKIIDFEGQILLQGVHDQVPITLFNTSK